MCPKSSLRNSLLLLTTCALAGCAVGPNYKRPTTVAPEHYKNVVQPAPTGVPADRWWTLFHDDLLEQLINQVDVSNQNLAAATAAYAEAIAVVKQDRAAFLPSIGATANVTRVKSGSGTSPTASVGTVGVAAPSTGRSSTTSTIYQFTGSATWELDVWGKLRRTLENASENARAQLADLASARLSAQAQLAIAYLQLRGADAELKLLEGTVDAYARTLQITRNRYTVGTAPKTDVLQAETQYYNAQQQQAATALQRAQLEDAVAALAGKAASDFHIAPRDEWNIPVPEIPAGVPSTLLERRPDIQAAEHDVAAANANVGVQVANYFPSFTLTGSLGFLSEAVGKLFNAANLTREAALSGSQTVFNFGGTQAQVAQARAVWDQSVATYRQTVITALQSVENDLAAADWDRKQYELLQQSSQAADENERLTLNEYKAGQVDYTTVVIAQAAALSARLSLAQSTVSRQTAAVSLVTDLGGGWTTAAAAKP
jgi:NodT family efflux transporter outer membrane factor (OMF) lipoprotein